MEKNYGQFNCSKKALIAIYIISAGLVLHVVTGTLLAYIMASYPDVPPTTVMQVMTLPMLVGLFVTLAIGPIAMKVDKKYLLMFASGCSLVYFAIFAIVGSGGPFNLLLAGAAFAGVTQGSGMTLVSSAIAEHIPQEKQANVLAASGALLNAGGAIISITGGIVAAGNAGADWPRAYFLGFIVIPITIAFFILMPKKPDVTGGEEHGRIPKSSSEFGNTPRNRIPAKVFLIFGVGFLFSLGLSTFMLNISVYVITEHNLGTSVESGLANTIFSMAGIFIGFTYAVWAKVFKTYLVVFGISCACIALFILMRFPIHIMYVYAASVLLGVGLNTQMPYIMSTLMKLTHPHLVPVVISLHMGALNLAMVLAPFILPGLGGLFGSGLHGQFMVGIIAMVLAAIASVFLFALAKSPNNPSVTPLSPVG